MQWLEKGKRWPPVLDLEKQVFVTPYADSIARGWNAPCATCTASRPKKKSKMKSLCINQSRCSVTAKEECAVKDSDRKSTEGRCRGSRLCYGVLEPFQSAPRAVRQHSRRECGSITHMAAAAAAHLWLWFRKASAGTRLPTQQHWGHTYSAHSVRSFRLKTTNTGSWGNFYWDHTSRALGGKNSSGLMLGPALRSGVRN